MYINKMHAISNQRGFSIIEVMISLVISLVLLGGLLSLYIAFNKSNFDLIKNIKLEQEIRATINFMAKDIKRAGFLDDTHENIGNASFCSLGYFDDCTNQNPLLTTTTSSMAFSYDADLDGAPENYSFSLINGAITYLYLGTTTPITDSGSTVFTNLTFTLSPRIVQITDETTTPATIKAELIIRELTITASAYPAGDDPSFARTVSQTVRIRNDEYRTL